MNVLTLCTAQVLGGAFLTGSVHALGNADEKTTITDSWLTITTRVNMQIEKDSHLKKAGIAVQTFAGVVSLSGEVPDFMTSAQASWTAWRVPGVKLVKNDLVVKEKA